MRLLPLLLLAGLSLPSLAQDPVTVLAPDKFAAEPAVITRVADVVAMQPDGTGYRERTFAVRIQSEAAVHDFSVISFQFAGASEHVDLHYLRVRRADGTTVETPASDMQEQPTAVTREAPFYSDQKEKQIPVRSLRVGDTLEWQVRIVRTKAEAPHEFWGEEGFSTTLVTLDETDELRVAKGSPVHVWTNPDETKPEESDTATDHVYLWRHHNLKPTTGDVAEIEKADAKRHYLTPEEEVDAREGKLPSIAWSTFPTWGAVGAWYRGLEHDRHTPDADIKAKVAELTAGKTTQEEKVRAVYDYVALQVRYVGVAFGIGRYQPHQASEVLSNQYGDCKDKHTLLAAMLDELGLHPDAVLIGEGVRFNEALPSPGAFNHLITQVAVDGKPVWLDATAETAPYRLLLYPIRDKQALVIPDEGMAHLERTPKDPPFAPFEKMTAVGTLNKDGVSESHIVITLHGDEEVYVRTILRQLPSGKYDAFVQALAANMGYGGTATHGSFTNLSDTTTPLSISFDYHREKAGDWDNYRIIPQLLPVGLGPVDEKDPPHRSIPLGMLTSNTSNAEMKLPDGWSAELPEAVHEKTDFATYDETYRLDKGTLYTERKITVLAERIPAKDWNQYKVWGDKVNLSGELYVQLTHTGAGMVIPLKGRSATAAPAPATTAEAKRLVRSALDSYNTGDYKAAGKSLDQAKSLDAGATGLWAGYGLVASAYGKSNEAIDDYRKELALHPDSTWVYSNIVRNQVRQARPDDAIATLHAWIAAEPYDPKPVITLMNQLMESGPAGRGGRRRQGRAEPHAGGLREGRRPAATVRARPAESRAGHSRSRDADRVDHQHQRARHHERCRILPGRIRQGAAPGRHHPARRAEAHGRRKRNLDARREARDAAPEDVPDRFRVGHDGLHPAARGQARRGADVPPGRLGQRSTASCRRAPGRCARRAGHARYREGRLRPGARHLAERQDSGDRGRAQAARRQDCRAEESRGPQRRGAEPDGDAHGAPGCRARQQRRRGVSPAAFAHRHPARRTGRGENSSGCAGAAESAQAAGLLSFRAGNAAGQDGHPELPC